MQHSLASNLCDIWQKALADEMSKPYFSLLETKLNVLAVTQVVFPARKNIFNAFNYTAPNQVKVVILGQDPYPTAGHAHGLCFSVEKSVRPLPKSLQNIFKELNSDMGVEMPSHGNLVHWAQQGVLLMNTILTVEEGRPGSHTQIGWERFTDYVIGLLNEDENPKVFLLWGSRAQSKKNLIHSTRHLILEAPHPSPLSVYRGYSGCKHFSLTNEFLSSHGLKPIDW